MVLAMLVGVLLPAVVLAQAPVSGEPAPAPVPDAVAAPVEAPVAVSPVPAEAVPPALATPAVETPAPVALTPPAEPGAPPAAAEGALPLPGEAAAEPVPDEPKDKARALATRGQALYDEGKYLEAASTFEAAQALFAHPSNLFNAAKAWEKAAGYEKAGTTYRAYLDLYKAQNGGAAPTDAADVERTIELMKEKAFLALPEVTIDSDPTGAEIYVDDPEKVLGQTPYTTHMPEGTHKVILKRIGHQGLERQFSVRSREPLRMTFAMEKLKTDGFVRVFTNIRKARIYIDGKVVAVSPFAEPLPCESGVHQVVVEKEEYTQVSQAVTVRVGTVSDVKLDLKLANKAFSWRGGLGVTSMILGGGSLGAAFWLRSMANKNDKNHGTYQKYEYVGFGVGAGLLALGIGLVVWEAVRSEIRPEDRIALDRIPMPVAAPTPEGRGFVLGAVAHW